MKIFSIEIKITLLIVFMALIVGAAGFVTYRSLSYILAAIKKEAQPNLTLVLLKELNGNLLKVEGNLKYYNLTGQDKYLKHNKTQFYLIEKKIEQLKWYNQADTFRFMQIDTLSLYLDEKFGVWDRMLVLQESSRVGEALTILQEKLDSVVDTVTVKVPTNVIIVHPDSLKTKISEADKEEEEHGNFFTRLFKRKSSGSSESSSSEPVVKELLEEAVAEKDTSFTIGIDKSFIQEEISRIRQAEGDSIRKFNSQEISLVKKNEYLTQRINGLIIRMERFELSSIGEKAAEADKLVEKTNKWVIVFLIAFANLLIAVLYVIQRYVRKSNAIQQNLIKSKDEALRLTRAKEVFMANMSHEIRTPMNAIIGFSDQVLQMPHDFQTKEQLTIIKKSADHLLKIINDILDLSKLEAGKLTIEKEAFSPLILFSDAIQLYKPSCSSKGLELEYTIADSVPEVLIGDAFRLKQIIFNLISNSVKFTDSGRISLDIETSPFSRSIINLKIKVSDTGIGIKADEMKYIFEEFQQADSHKSRRFGGTGLGLSIVKKLIELQNGTLKVESTPGVGTTFNFVIPFKIGKKEDIKTGEIKQVYSEAIKDFSFLVADDDEYNRKLIAHILGKWKIKFTLVGNGKELIEEIEKNKYDIILMDIRMPEIDGIQATEIIRKNTNNYISKIPIIALTATIAKEEIERCRNVGIESIVLKPYSEELLFAHVANALKIETGAINILDDTNDKSSLSTEFHSMFENLYRLANNDDKFVVEMLEMFVKTSKEGLEEIKISMDENNCIDIAEIAHKIKSPCKHLGALEVADLLKEIELMARNGGSIIQIKPLVEKLNNDMGNLMQKIDNYLKTIAKQ